MFQCGMKIRTIPSGVGDLALNAEIKKDNQKAKENLCIVI